MALTFRVAHTPITNTIFSGKPLSEVDVKLFHYGEPMENTIFKTKDENGDTTLLQSWRRECLNLNKQYPDIHHWIDTEQPDKDGVYYRGLPGEQWANETRIAASFKETDAFLQMIGRGARPKEPFEDKQEIFSPYPSLWPDKIGYSPNDLFNNPEGVSEVQRLFIDAITSDDPAIRGKGIAMMQKVLGLAAERIVVLQSLLESERNLRQADRDFATKNETYL